MKMYNWTLIFLALFPLGMVAQDFSKQDRQLYQDADFAFDSGDYAFALMLFEELHQKHKEDPLVNYKLAASLISENKNIDRALKLLKKSMHAGETEAIFHYARALHRSEMLEEAIYYFYEYKKLNKKNLNNKEVDRHIEMVLRARRLMANPVDVEIISLGENVNTAFQEYVPVVTPDNEFLYFTSRRPDTHGGEQDPNGEFFEDIYSSHKNEYGHWTRAKNAGSTVNTNLNDATVAVSADGNEMIIFRTNKNLTGGDLYITKKINNTWSEPVKLNDRINSIYQETSACFSPDKKTLYFSSNRPDGFGGKDIYRVKVLPNGEWSLPKNLGPTINSKYDEDAPFMDIDGSTLYFASNGHTSMGGFDIFQTKLIGDEVWDSPENIGYPINTVADDIFFTVDAGGRTGYYSSDQPGGQGGQDLYKINFIYRQKTQLVIKSSVQNTEGLPVEARVSLIDQSDNELQGIYNTNRRNGKFILIVNPLTMYKVIIEADGYHPITMDIFHKFPADEKEFVIDISPFRMIEN